MEKTVLQNMEQLLKRPAKQNDIRITTYLEADLYDEIMRLKCAGLSIKKIMNEAVTDLLKKYDLI